MSDSNNALRSIAHAVDKSRLAGRYGAVTPETMAHVEEAIKVATGLTAF